MDNETVKHLWALQKVNGALIEGLKVAIFVLERGGELSKERRKSMEKHQQNIEFVNSDKIIWLANQIFTAFPKEITGLKFCILDCCCIYYQRVFRDRI